MTQKFMRNSKLRCAHQFQAVFTHTRIKVFHRAFIILGIVNTLSHPRLGMVVAKRKIRKAHDRNRVKRLFRESFRLSQHQISGIDIVIIAQHHLASMTNKEITQELNKTWIKAQKIYQTLSKVHTQ